MKTNRLKTLVAAGAGAMFMAQGAQAALTYAYGDMILGFRKAVGTSNLEVNLGSVSQIQGILGTGQSLYFSTKFNAADITAGVGTAAAGSLDNAIWSVSAAINAPNQVPATAKNTLWLTSARGLNSADVNTQTPPWLRESITSQGNTVAPVTTIGSGFSAGTGNAGSTTAAVLADGANSYHDNIKDTGNFAAFQGNIENTLAANFTTAGTVARSDFYQITPNAAGGDSTYLGYFQFSPVGEFLTFVAVPESGTFAASVAAGFMVLALMRAHRKSLAHS